MRMPTSALIGIVFCAVWGVIVTMSAVYALTPQYPFVVCFDVGSATINSSGAKALEEVASQSQRIGRRSRLDVEARTDAAETRSHDITLSAVRGSAVKEHLVKLGVPHDRINVRAYSKPLVPSENAEPQNRCALVWSQFDP